MNTGNKIYDLCNRLFPICRSITGNGNRKTLEIIKELIPININEISTGTNIFDWIIPKEWNINDAYVENFLGEKVIDFKKNNLHVVNYSSPINKIMSKEELLEHIHSDPDYPEAIPYVTSYYEKRWGFCIADVDRKSLIGDVFNAVIDSSIDDGSLTYADLIIPGREKKEILISTYICHPSMANNECSGPSLATYLSLDLLKSNNRYTYRFVFAPETIGAIAYISQNFNLLKNNVVHALNLTCVGDNKNYSFMATRLGNTTTDKIARHVLKYYTDNHIEYPFTERGSDERQYCHPSVNIPMISLMRSKYGTYKEYHTSKDDMSFVSSDGFAGSYNINKKCINAFESNYVYSQSFLCEPMLMKRNLVPKDWIMRRTSSKKCEKNEFIKRTMNVLFQVDGINDLIDISNNLDINYETCIESIDVLIEQKIINKHDVIE